MKKAVVLLVFLFLVAILACLVSAYQERTLTGKTVSILPNFLRKADISITYSFNKPEFILSSGINQTDILQGNFGEIYYTPSMGLELSGDPGMPLIPYKTAKILVPYGKAIDSVEVKGINKEYLGKYNLKYGENFAKTSEFEYKENITKVERNNEIYSSNNDYPGILNSRYEIQKLDGYSILIINLFPLQYNPKSGDVYYYKDIEVTIYTSSLTSASALSESKYLRTDTKDIKRILGEVNNPDKISSYSGRIGLLNIPTPGETYDYIIITNNDLNNSNGAYKFKDLINWKKGKGLKAEIFTTEDILYNPAYNCDGLFGDGCNRTEYNDTSARIRNFIREMYQNHGTRYVLLGGDGDGANVGGESGNNIIPARLFWPRYQYEDSSVASDNYYSNLDGSMDGNKNGYFGEPDDGENGADIDLYAEVFIGRAPVDSATEVSNFVRKTIWYENYTMHQLSNYGDVDIYLKTALMAGEYLGFGEPADYGDNSKEEVRLGSSEANYTTVGFPSQYYVDTLYDSGRSGCSNADSRNPACWTASDMLDKMNSGAQIINHLGHASTNIVMKLCHNLGGDCTYCNNWNSTDLNNLTNDKYFFAYSQGCYPGSFDNWNYEGCYSKTDSIGENFVVKEHGAFAVIMNSRYGWGRYESTDGASQRYDRQFYDAIFGENKTRLGEANQDSKEENIGGIQGGYYNAQSARVLRWVYYGLTLLGDPETSLYIPPEFNHNIGIVNISTPSLVLEPKENYNFSVIVKNNGKYDESNIQVSLRLNNNLLGTKTVSLSKDTSTYLNFSWYSSIGGKIDLSASISLSEDDYPWDNSFNSSVVVAPLKLLGNYWDYGQDTTGDGLYDKLVIGTRVDSIMANNFSFCAGLYTSDGNFINYSYGGYNYTYYNGTLVASGCKNYDVAYGINDIEIPLPTYNIKRLNLSGRYILANIGTYYYSSKPYIGINMYKTWAYNTSYYDSSQFDILPLNFTRTFSNYVYDKDGNGKYDYLVFNAGVNISYPGTYGITHIISNDSVYSYTSGLISGGYYYPTSIYFGHKGLYNISFPILGQGINMRNLSGKYYFNSISANVRDSSYTYSLDSLFSNDSTPYYDKDNFEGAGGYLNNINSESAVDFNGDGLYDVFIISMGINVTKEGLFTLYGTLYDYNSEYNYGGANTYMYLKKGDNKIDLKFSGQRIAGTTPANKIFRLRWVQLSYFGAYIGVQANPYNTSSYDTGTFSKTYLNLSSLYLSSLSMPRFIEENESFLINFTIQNAGAESGVFNVSFFDGENLLKKVQVSNVPNNTNVYLSTNLNLTNGVHTLYAVLDNEKNLKEDPRYSNSRVLYIILVVGNPFGSNCGNGIIDEGEVCDIGNDTACPGRCLSNCSCQDLDITPPYVAFISPINNAVYNTSNITVSIINNSDAKNIWWFNGTENFSYFSPVNLTLTNGNYLFIAYANDSSGNLNSTNVLFSVNYSSCTDNDLDGWNSTSSCNYNNIADCNDSNLGIYPGAVELCNNIDDDCDNGIDENLIQNCGSGICTGLEICSSGIWGDCSSKAIDAGICSSCDSSGSIIYNSSQNSDCSFNNINVAECFYNPDNIGFTWDSFNFNSACLNLNLCTNVSSDWKNSITHSCDKARCQAGCEANSDCLCQQDECRDADSDGKLDDFYNYPENGTCNSTCGCNSASCQPTITLNDGVHCGECVSNDNCTDNLACNGLETCQTGFCQTGNLVNCSTNNINRIATCNDTSDNNPFTFDYRQGFISSCAEPGTCAEGNSIITHSCNKTCGAECEKNEDVSCPADGCVGNDYYDYPETGECNSTCQEVCIPRIDINNESCMNSVQINITPAINFISIHLILENNSLANITSGNENNIRAIYGYNNSWKVYYPSHPELSSLSSFEPGKGYVVIANSNFSLNLAGEPWLGNFVLSNGWNLIGGKSGKVSDFFSGKSVFKYDNGYVELNQDSNLSSDKSYWVYQ